MSKSKYYDLKNILSKGALYNLIIGERSNGKTYAAFKRGLENYVKNGEQFAVVRRWREDFTGKRGQSMFQALVDNNVIEDLTGGQWTGIYYWSSRWYFCTRNGDDMVKADEPFAYGFSISSMEHDKSTSFPRITSIIFDEFLTRTVYIDNEFVLFMNVISTIVRDRDNVKIFMLGNTVNKYCPYFTEMGLKHIKQMQPGDIDLYQYGSSKLLVAVEYCSPNKTGKASDVYFAFDNPKLNMITGGAWELDIYPHCPVKFTPADILFTYFIKFDGELLQCEIVQHEDVAFTFIHRKTTEIKNPEKDLIFTPEFSPRPNYRRKLTSPYDALGKKIAYYYAIDKVFYQDNEIGEIVRNYLQWCK